MATDYQALLDMLKPKEEEEPIMNSMGVIPQRADMPIPQPDIPEFQSPMIPDNTPQEQVFSTPQLSNIIDQSQVPMSAQVDMPQALPDSTAQETPMTRTEALLAEYNRLAGRDQEALAEARSSDRMLKVGGALGDALATYLNAQGQMNVKAPGVQVQQGAGLGKIADMFATAPEIASDAAQRREALMKQYTQLSKGEQSELDRNLSERRIKAYEDQVKAQAKKLETDAKEKIKKPTVGEQTIDREFAKKYNEWRTGGRVDYEENKKIFDEAIKALEDGKISTGSVEGIGARIPGVRTEARQLETRVRKALNSMLRATLGAQFTEGEGERIFAQTFDPFASPTENIKNMQTELSKIEKRAKDIESQGEYFTKEKTLSEFSPQINESEKQTKQLSEKDKQALDWANKNPTDSRADEIKKRLGM
jgi:predicted  nucleic acid-binding Zn-ribbon protein